MRASEMALIEAEARAENNDIAGSKTVLEDLIKIRNPYFVAKATKDDLLRQIAFQRRIELWGEGFAFSDIKRYMAFSNNSWIPDVEKGLKRTGGNHDPQIAQLMTLAAWSNTFLFRIPGGELNNNSALTGADQNP
jgi:hypothetical protein